MTVFNLKTPSGRDPARKALAASIALHAGAKRDLRVADEAASLADQRCWAAQARLDDLRKVGEPKGSLAADFIASVASGSPSDVAVLERSSVESRSKISSAENEFSVWNQTREECDLAAREKEVAVTDAKERVEKAARCVIANSETVARLLDGVEEMTAEVINRRVALRFILFSCLNGELLAADREKIENLFRTDRRPAGFHSAYNTGWEMHDIHKKWAAAFDELLSNAEAEIPS
jgi:hypothetical protein